jgi:hypothetical protein
MAVVAIGGRGGPIHALFGLDIDGHVPAPGGML